MELITERSRIKGVADAWDAQYGPDFRPIAGGSSKTVSEKLHALNLSRVSAATVNKIIGNDLSFAAAHGLEMTFSFGNVVAHGYRKMISTSNTRKTIAIR